MRVGLMSLALAAAATASLAFAGAKPVPLDVKTGLWDMTYITTMSGASPVPPDVLAKMSAAQRAQIAARFAKPRTTHSKDCVTSKDLADGAFAAGDDDEADCKRTIVASTATHNESSFVCSGDEPRTGTLKVDALSRESITAEVNSQRGGSKVTVQATGKWLAAACGNVE